MGKFSNKLGIRILSWFAAIIIVGLNIKLVGQELTSFFTSDYGNSLPWLVLLYASLAFIAFLLIYVTVNPIVTAIKEKQMIPHQPIQKLDLSKPDTFHKIGITVDFTSHDEIGIKHALDLGGKNAHYFLIHIVESAAAKQYGEEVMDKETLKDLQWIQSYARDLKEAGYNVEYRLGYGARARNIKKISEICDLQLLVMGAHGHSGIKDLIFGSTVDAVRHMVKIPILVVR